MAKLTIMCILKTSRSTFLQVNKNATRMTSREWIMGIKVRKWRRLIPLKLYCCGFFAGLSADSCMFFSSPEMRGMECCVKNCGSSSHDHLGRTLQNGLSFHCVPAWRMEEGPRISDLTKRRRAAWLAAVGREDITFDRIPSSMRVCSKHFVSGEPKQIYFSAQSGGTGTGGGLASRLATARPSPYWSGRASLCSFTLPDKFSCTLVFRV